MGTEIIRSKRFRKNKKRGKSGNSPSSSICVPYILDLVWHLRTWELLTATKHLSAALPYMMALILVSEFIARVI